MIRFFRSVRRLAGPEGRRLLLPVVFSLLDSLFNSCMYGVMLFVLLDLAAGQFTGRRLAWYTGGIAALFLLRCIAQCVSFTGAQCTGSDISRRLRMTLGNHLRSLNLGFFNQNSIGRLSSILLTDVSDFETIITHCLCDAVKVSSFALLALAVSFLLDWRFGLAQSLLTAVALPLLLLSGRLSARNTDALRAANREAVSRIVEYINGMRTFRLYNLTGSRFSRLDGALRELKRCSVRSELTVLPLSMGFSALTGLLVPAALLVGARLWGTAQWDAARFLLAILLAISLSSTLTVARSLYPQMRSIDKAAASILSVLDEPPLPYRLEQAGFRQHSVVFDRVCFGYNKDTEVLHGISFTARPGTVTALIGPSGSGKTTIVSLLARFWDVTSGQIRIDGADIRQFHPDALAGQMAIVFQETYLLQDTVMNNIRIGRPDATDAEVIAAAQAACCHEFILAMEQGYNTLVGEGGSTLSGGEKQRIAIARALLRDAPIVLLDETTASLDAGSEQAIQRAFDRLMKGKTVFVIAHRLDTILHADNILVLDKGRIRESGSHASLMQQGGWYAQMIQQQRKAETWSVRGQ